MLLCHILGRQLSLYMGLLHHLCLPYNLLHKCTFIPGFVARYVCQCGVLSSFQCPRSLQPCSCPGCTVELADWFIDWISGHALVLTWEVERNGAV